MEGSRWEGWLEKEGGRSVEKERKRRNGEEKEGRRRGKGRQDKVRLEKEIRVDECRRESGAQWNRSHL